MQGGDQEWLDNLFRDCGTNRSSVFHWKNSLGHKLAVARVMCSRELDKRVELPWQKRVRSWKHGFNSSSYLLYDLDHRDPRLFLSDVPKQFRAWRVNSHHDFVIGNKIAQYDLFRLHGCPQPPLRGVIMGGQVNTQPLWELLEQHQKLVLKPIWGGGGTGILFLEHRGDTCLINDRSYTRDDILRLSESLDDYLICDFVVQARYAREIFADSTNTLRLLTLKHDGKAYIAAAVHRFGKATKLRVDNFGQGWGGLSCAIDVETGLMSEGANLTSEGRTTYPSHPDTGARIEGVEIPKWSRITRELLEVADKLPCIHWLGWDLVATDDGWVCLEANPNPGVQVWQVHTPLLEDPRSRAFFKRHGVIP